MTEDKKLTRLPPPAFTPPSRRPDPADVGSASQMDSAALPPADGNDAFFYPEPEYEVGGDVSFITPEDPLPLRGDVEEGTATGIGDDAHVLPEELVTGGDPYLAELTGSITKLAEALRRRGEAGLHASPEMSRFDATLRAYCVGFLAGRRAEGTAERR